RTRRAGGRARVTARESARSVGEAAAPATLLADGAGEPGRGATRRGRQTAHAPRRVGGAARAGAALVRFHAQLTEHAAVIRHRVRRLRAAAHALGAHVADTRAARRAGGAALLLRLAAGPARAAVRPIRRRRTQARAAFLAIHAQLQRRPATRQGLTARAAAWHVHATAAATGVADRARLAVDATRGQQLADEDAALAAGGAGSATAFVAL